MRIENVTVDKSYARMIIGNVTVDKSYVRMRIENVAVDTSYVRMKMSTSHIAIYENIQQYRNIYNSYSNI